MIAWRDAYEVLMCDGCYKPVAIGPRGSVEADLSSDLLAKTGMREIALLVEGVADAETRTLIGHVCSDECFNKAVANKPQRAAPEEQPSEEQRQPTTWADLAAGRVALVQGELL